MRQFEIDRNKAGEFTWRIRESANGKILGDSGEGYDKLSECLKRVQEIKRDSRHWPVVDLTGKTPKSEGGK